MSTSTEHNFVSVSPAPATSLTPSTPAPIGPSPAGGRLSTSATSGRWTLDWLAGTNPRAVVPFRSLALIGYILVVAFVTRLLAAKLGWSVALLSIGIVHLALGAWGAFGKATTLVSEQRVITAADLPAPAQLSATPVVEARLPPRPSAPRAHQPPPPPGLAFRRGRAAPPPLPTMARVSKTASLPPGTNATPGG